VGLTARGHSNSLASMQTMGRIPHMATMAASKAAAMDTRYQCRINTSWALSNREQTDLILGHLILGGLINKCQMLGISPILVLTRDMEGGQIMDGKRYVDVAETEGEGEGERTKTDVVVAETITVMARFLQQGLGQQMSTPQLDGKRLSKSPPPLRYLLYINPHCLDSNHYS
jgi:hypothetical protein